MHYWKIVLGSFAALSSHAVILMLLHLQNNSHWWLLWAWRRGRNYTHFSTRERGFVPLSTAIATSENNIDQHIYKEVLWYLFYSVHENRRRLWQGNHDNTPVQTILNIEQFLIKRNIAMLELKGVNKGSFWRRGRHQYDCDDECAKVLGKILPVVHGGVAGKDENLLEFNFKGLEQ